MKVIKLFLITFLIAEFLSAQSTEFTKIPFELEGNHIFIKVKVNGSEELDFMFDTGMTVTAVNLKTAERLGLSDDKKINTGGASGKFYAQLSKNNKIVFAGLQLNKVNLEKISLLNLERKIGRDIDGLIGFSLLKKYVVKVNYDSLQLELYPSKKFKYTGDGEVFDMNVGKLCFIAGRVKVAENKEVSGDFILDTGAGLALALTTPFSKKNQIEKVLGAKYTKNVATYGENEATVNVGLLKQFDLQRFTFKNVPTSIFSNPTGLFSNKVIAGVIGNELLKKFNIIFDYKAKKSYWEPNDSYYGKMFPTECSGLVLSLNQTKTIVVVENIIAKSVGNESKIKEGDEIVEINGIRADEVALFELRKLLSQNGKEVKIKYRRGEIVDEIILKLRALI